MVKEIEYRFELKFLISEAIARTLKKHLSMVMEMDPHSICKEYSYLIRSVYFDDPFNSAYHEKVDGVEYRAKYRLRMYNHDDSVLKLECKHKDENMTYKDDCRVDRETAELLLEGRYDEIDTNNEFFLQFLTEAKMKHLMPTIIVDYKRVAFTYPVSEIRITFDEELKSGRHCLDFFDPFMETYDIYPDNQMVLEVKCNEFIPDHILAILASVPKLRSAVSKFELCKTLY